MLSSTTTSLTSPLTSPPASANESWNIARVLDVVGGALPPVALPDFISRPFAPNAVSTDSRTIAPGQFFLALRGEVHDGHAHVPVAIERGAAGLIVARDYTSEFDSRLPVIRVDDTLAAYGALAAAVRRDWGGPVLAISGSVGKTTTRRLVARAFASRMKTLEPIRNFNNLIGLPETILRLEPDHRVAVLEMGMNTKGEIGRLCDIARPDAGCLTRIGRTHIGMFANHGELIAEKLMLFRKLSPGAPVVWNASCPNTAPAMPEFENDYRLRSFRGDGSLAADVFATNIRTLDASATSATSRASNGANAEPRVGFRFDLETPEGRIEDIVLPRFGRHLIEDVAAAAALIGAAGFEPSWVREAVENFETEPLRGEIVARGEYTLILDCYNAAPESMAASLESLAALCDAQRRARLILVLADMLELGEHARAEHDALLPLLRGFAPARHLGLGPESARIAATLADEGRVAKGFSDRDELLAELRRIARPGDWIYFKGSHGFALEKIASEFRE